MNKFIRAFPQSEFKFRLYDNFNGKTWKQIKKDTGCFALVNCGYFNMKTFETASAFMVNGEWKYQPDYHEYGLLISKDGTLSIGTEKDAVCDYCVGLPPMLIENKKYSGAIEVGSNGNTMVGFKKDGTPIFLICGKDEKQTGAQGVSDLKNVGCTDVFRFDGSWSTQGSLGDGMDLQPSQRRIARNYILVFKKKQDVITPDTSTIKPKPVKPVNAKRVYISPSMQHKNGNKKYNYIESDEMNLIADLIIPELKRHGIVTMRNDPNSDLSVVIPESNKFLADLHLALHSNAHSASLPDSQKTARGALTYVWKDEKEQGKYAREIVKEMDKIQPFSNRGSGKVVANSGLWETADTNAPAVIVEVDFHDNEGAKWIQDNRKNIADALVKSTLNYFGMKYIEKDVKPPETTPWYDECRAWVVQNKIADGTRPLDTATRAEVWQMLYNYKKNI